MKPLLLITGVLVAATAVATAQWWTLVSVPVVWWAAFRWRPSWRRKRRNAAPQPDLPTSIVELDHLRRWRTIIVPVALVAVGLNGWAYHEVITVQRNVRENAITLGFTASGFEEE